MTTPADQRMSIHGQRGKERKTGDLPVWEADTAIDVHDHCFHFLWLRDNCLCCGCCEPSSFQKLVDDGRFPGSAVVKRIDLDDETLRIEWDEQPGHLSVFPVSRLLAHAYDPPAEPDGEVRTLWETQTWRDREPAWHDLSDCTPEGGEWADDLARYGFCLLGNVTEESLDARNCVITSVRNVSALLR